MRFLYKYLILMFLCLVSCSVDSPQDRPDTPSEVGFYAGKGSGIGIQMRSEAGSDGISTSWEPGDKLALWAYDQNGKTLLDGQVCSAYGENASIGYFTTSLPDVMPDGEYRYFASYPVPEWISGSKACFSVPSTQNGHSGAGEDIMISSLTSAGPLRPLDWESYGHEELHLSMEHLLHRFCIYTTSSLFHGETIKRITASFPKGVVGKITVDLQNPLSSPVLTDAKDVLDIIPEEPMAVSSGNERHYVTASIVPTSFAAGESMNVRIYTDSYMASVDILLASRYFAAGHSTPVNLLPKTVSSYYQLHLNLAGNHLGENPQTVTVNAPAGYALNDAGESTLILRYGKDISVGGSYVLGFEDEAKFRHLSGTNLSITYESEHAVVSENVTVPDLTSGASASVELNVPYLLYEDFSQVPTFSSNDEYTTSSAGSMNAHSFLNGWSGGRVGASAGNMVRLACRRECGMWVEALYDSRMESAPLARIKSPVALEVSFDYGAGNRYLNSDDNLGQTVSVGYVTSATAYKSGSTDGTYDASSSLHLPVSEYSTGAWTTPGHATVYVPSVPAGQNIRISWKSHMDSNAVFAGNATAWFYLDNVKVSISDK